MQLEVHGRSFQGYRMKKKADWQAKGGPDLAQAPRLGGIPSSIVGPGPTDLPTSLVPKYQSGIMSASQNNSAGRQAYSYVLCKSEEELHTPLSLLVGHLEVLRGQLSPKCSLRQQQSSGRPASL